MEECTTNDAASPAVTETLKVAVTLPVEGALAKAAVGEVLLTVGAGTVVEFR